MMGGCDFWNLLTGTRSQTDRVALGGTSLLCRCIYRACSIKDRRVRATLLPGHLTVNATGMESRLV